MKQIIAFAAAFILCLSCAACGCTNSEPATMPNTDAVLPDTMPNPTVPPMATNIPDPDVDPYATEATDGTDSTNGTSSTDSTDGALSRFMDKMK